MVITNRLLLRTPRLEDLDAYVAVFTHPEVSAWMRPDPQPPATPADIRFREAGKIEHAGLPHIIYRRVLA